MINRSNELRQTEPAHVDVSEQICYHTKAPAVEPTQRDDHE